MDRWNGFEVREGEFEGRRAIMVLAPNKKRTDCWMMKMEDWDRFPGLEIAMLNRGWNLAYVENEHRWCSPEDLARKERYAEFVQRIFGFRQKFVPVGIGSGGMIAVQFAARYPELVQALVLEAPVLNLLSCPGDLGRGHSGLWAAYAEATGMTMARLICSREMPMDQLPVLAGYRIPTVLIYGTADEIVPFEENGALLQQFCEGRNMPFLAIPLEGCGHDALELPDPVPAAEFLQEHAQ